MAWYGKAQRMELLPEARQQPVIRPTQFIVHSIVAPWEPRRLYEYWRDSTSLESHFGLGYSGDLAQYLPTTIRADANASANRRPDGTGAISVETASNTSASDRWTAAQVKVLVELGVWAHRTHGVPLRICRSASDPGFGWHALFREWSSGGTACPGNARIAQFKDEVFPAILASARGVPQNDSAKEKENVMALSKKDLDDIAIKVLTKDGVIPNPHPPTAKTNTHISLTTAVRNIEIVTRRNESLIREQARRMENLERQISDMARKLDALRGQPGG